MFILCKLKISFSETVCVQNGRHTDFAVGQTVYVGYDQSENKKEFLMILGTEREAIGIPIIN